MLKKFLIIFLSSLFLSGCSNIKTEKKVINFSSWGSVTETTILKKIISDFEKENSDIKINFIHIPENYFQKLHLLFASNTEPDVIFINNLYLPIYKSYLMDLSEMIDKNVFYKQALEGVSYDGKIYAYPRDVSNLVLYVNRDAIKKIPPNWSLENLLDILQKQKCIKYGIGTEEDLFWIMPYLTYYGEIFDENFSSKNSKALSFYKNLKHKYKVSPTKSQVGSSTLAQMFIDEKLAIYMAGRWMYPKIQEKATFNWSIESFPQGENNLPCDTSGWAISKNTKLLNDSIRFAEYLSSEKSLKYFTQSGLIVPARITTSHMLENDNHNEKMFLTVLKNSKSLKIPKNYKKMVDKFNKENF